MLSPSESAHTASANVSPSGETYTSTPEIDNYIQTFMAKMLIPYQTEIERAHTRIKSMEATIIELQAQVHQFNKPPTNTPGATPMVAAVPALPQQNTPTYASITAATPTPAKKIMPTSKAKRIFAQPTENKGYQFVYLPQSGRTPMNEIRRALSAHDINNARVMDIHFPARNVCGLLVHNDFAPELVSKLNKLGTETLPLFNPNSPDIISDPIHNGKTPEEKADLATKLQKNRAIRIINRSHPRVRNSLTRSFITQGIINNEDLNNPHTPSPTSNNRHTYFDTLEKMDEDTPNEANLPQ